jgi:hypothetical protein
MKEREECPYCGAKGSLVLKEDLTFILGKSEAKDLKGQECVACDFIIYDMDSNARVRQIIREEGLKK